MRVKSAVDLWFKFLAAAVIISMLSGILVSFKEDRLQGLPAVFLVTFFFLWICFDTYYELREDYLYCRSGPFFEKIPYDKIKSVKLTRNILSSMALSVNRIEIRQHGKGYLLGTTLISPVDREEFLQSLIERCPHLENI